MTLKQGFANRQGSYNPFYLGQVGMMFTAQWNTWWVKKFRPDVDYGVAPLPYLASHPERAGSASDFHGELDPREAGKNETRTVTTMDAKVR